MDLIEDIVEHVKEEGGDCPPAVWTLRYVPLLPPTHPSIHIPTYPSNQPPIHPPTYSQTRPSIHPPTHPPTHPTHTASSSALPLAHTPVESTRSFIHPPTHPPNYPHSFLVRSAFGGHPARLRVWKDLYKNGLLQLLDGGGGGGGGGGGRDRGGSDLAASLYLEPPDTSVDMLDVRFPPTHPPIYLQHLIQPALPSFTRSPTHSESRALAYSTN